MFHKIKYKINEKIFVAISQGIYNTPPVQLTREGGKLCLLSQLQDKDLAMYLLAAKSFLHKIPAAKCIVIGDGLCTTSQKQIQTHIIGSEVFDIKDFQTADIPNGGTWERLNAISHFVQDNFVVQMDADTLTLKDLNIVNTCITSKKAFLLGTASGSEIIPIAQAIEFAEPHFNKGNKHIQILAEKNLHLTKKAGCEAYVRGCSGFAGFPKNSFNHDRLASLSAYYHQELGTSWLEWGSEQFMSNLIISNMPKVAVLPHNKYGVPVNYHNTSVFVHFIGEQRYQTYLYSKLAKSFISSIK